MAWRPFELTARMHQGVFCLFGADDRQAMHDGRCAPVQYPDATQSAVTASVSGETLVLRI